MTYWRRFGLALYMLSCVFYLKAAILQAVLLGVGDDGPGNWLLLGLMFVGGFIFIGREESK